MRVVVDLAPQKKKKLIVLTRIFLNSQTINMKITRKMPKMHAKCCHNKQGCFWHKDWSLTTTVTPLWLIDVPKPWLQWLSPSPRSRTSTVMCSHGTAQMREVRMDCQFAYETLWHFKLLSFKSMQTSSFESKAWVWNGWFTKWALVLHGTFGYLSACCRFIFVLAQASNKMHWGPHSTGNNVEETEKKHHHHTTVSGWSSFFDLPLSFSWGGTHWRIDVKVPKASKD